MATWMTHFRIADYFLEKLVDISEDDFIVGNIGPDCGEPDETWSSFNPPKEITHWLDDDGKADAEKFYCCYLDKKVVDVSQYSFYLGYYVHLLTDREWSETIGAYTKLKWKDDFESLGRLPMWDKIKKDWYDIDHLFLKNNSQFYTFKEFFKLQDYNNDYLPYYSKTALPKQIKYISEFYCGSHEELDRQYEYLTPKEMDEFINNACGVIEKILSEKGIV